MALSVLLVAPTDAVAVSTCLELRRAGAHIAFVDSFADARMRLKGRPDVLISEVRLGAYNGLHLAICALARGIPAVVIGDDDPVARREAEKLGAMYLVGCGTGIVTLLQSVDYAARTRRAIDAA